jgi:beta-lactamase regulating signal transducer with metallopeptidase domain
MRYFVLLGFLSAGAYAVTVACAAAAVVRVWPPYHRAVVRLGASRRAYALAALRVAPCGIGVAAALAVAGVFLRFEPRHTTESPGAMLIAAGLATLLLIATGAIRGLRAALASRQCTRLVRTCGRRLDRSDAPGLWIVDTAYPVAAVTGVLRPRLLLSTRILRECPAGEVQAILRHEAAHLRRRDNLLRAIMLILPDPLQFGETGRSIHSTWAAAAEQAADEQAAGDEAETRATLAAALVRVSRMTRGCAPPWASGVAFFEGHNLEERVQRLLAPAGSTRRPPAVISSAALMLLAASAAAVAANPIALRLRTLMEGAVNYLP